MAEDRMNNLVRWLGGVEEAHFFTKLDSAPDQTVLDMVFDLESMGQYALAARLLEQFGKYHTHTTMTLYTLAYLRRKQGMDCGEILRLADAAGIIDTTPPVWPRSGF